MPNYKTFTWNMQRGRSLLPAATANETGRLQAKARLEMLGMLCGRGDIGFVTEPGMDLHQAVSTPNQTSLLAPQGLGYWNCSTRVDNQLDGSACRNLLFSKLKLINCDLNYLSGGDSAFRYPAAGAFEVEGVKVLLATLHATSSYTAAANADGLLDFLDESSSQRKKADAVVIGGDMNSNSRHFNMPEGATHQSGHTLDGFTYDVYNDNIDHDVTVSFAHTAVSHSHTHRKLVTSGTSETIPPGYYVKESSSGHWARVSDHAPVLTEVTLQVTADMSC